LELVTTNVRALSAPIAALAAVNSATVLSTNNLFIIYPSSVG